MREALEGFLKKFIFLWIERESGNLMLTQKVVSELVKGTLTHNQKSKIAVLQVIEHVLVLAGMGTDDVGSAS